MSILSEFLTMLGVQNDFCIQLEIIKNRLLLDSGLIADLCNYTSGIDMDARMFGGEHLGSPLRSPERRGESCIRPLCLIRPYAQKLRLHRAMYAFRRSTRNPIKAILDSRFLIGRIFLLGERCIEHRPKNWRPLVGWNRRASRTFG